MMSEEGYSNQARRSRMEVKIDILQAIAEGAERPTHIMYRSNLSWSVMQSFVRAMEEQGLLKTSDSDGKRNYSLTPKGQRVLKTYLDVKKQLDSASAQLARPPSNVRAWQAAFA